MDQESPGKVGLVVSKPITTRMKSLTMCYNKDFTNTEFSSQFPKQAKKNQQLHFCHGNNVLISKAELTFSTTCAFLRLFQ
jgi:hypothetical protein